MIKIEQAKKEQSFIIASFIMEAMNYECCQWFIGENNSLNSFHQLLSRLVEKELSQYSYRNTFVAITEENEVVGACVCYEGALVGTLRKTFEEEMFQTYHKDYSSLPYETKAGEFYIDSICVHKAWRKKGIATKLLIAAINKAANLKLPATLLVDTGNPKAENLYNMIGFEYFEKTNWGGHKMKRLIYIKKQ